MSVFRVQKTRNFTIMSNHHLQDNSLSFKARGILSTMLSLPDDWDYTLVGLAKIAKDSVSAVKSGIAELEEAGYIKRAQGRAKNGQFSKNIYDVYEIPLIVDETEENTVESVDNITPSSEQRKDNLGFEEPLCENYAEDEISETEEVSPSPLSGFPSSAELSAEKPLAENHAQLNTNKQKTELQNTYLQKTQSIYPIYPNNEGMMIDRIDRSKSTSGIKRTVETYNCCKELIKQNIGYDSFVQSRNESEMQEIDEIVAVMAEVVAFAENPIYINKDPIPADMVRARFLKVGYHEIDYVIFALHRNYTKIGNIRSYLISAVYNAPSTMNTYWGAEVRHDFGGA